MLIRTFSTHLVRHLSASVLKSALAVATATTLSTTTGCLPSEVSIPVKNQVSAQEYAGFTGIVSAQTINGTRVRLQWNSSVDPEVIAYKIYDTSLLFEPKLVRTVPAPITRALISDLNPEQLYRFRVRAASIDNIEDSNENDLSVVTYDGATEAVVTSSTTASIVFAEATNASSVEIYCKTGSGPYQLQAIVDDVTRTSAEVGGLSAGTSYQCRAHIRIDGVLDNNNNFVEFVPIGVATRMVFFSQPTGSAVGIPFPSQPVIHILDENDNIVSAGPDSDSLVSLQLSPGSESSGTLRGLGSSGIISVQAVRGVATFSSLNFQEVGRKLIRATKEDTSAQSNGSGPLTIDSNEITILPGEVSPVTSTITLTPGSGVRANGFDAYAVTIKLTDRFGNPVPGIVPRFESTNPSDSVIQPVLPTSTEDGETSGSISSTQSGISILSISSPAGLRTVTTLATFDAGAANRVVFLVQPKTAEAGNAKMDTVRVAVQDNQGNTVISSSAQVTIGISPHASGGVLSGTITRNAVNGIADFSGLGIDKKGTGYQLVASSFGLAAAVSNSFNINAGIPAKIGVSGPEEFRTTNTNGQCSSSSPVVIQLQDQAGNASGTELNLNVEISGLGDAQLYTSSLCQGTPVSSISFTIGSSTKNYYLKSQKAESLSLIASSIPASVLQSGTFEAKVSGNQIGITTPISVRSGLCSQPIVISSFGADGIAGPLFADTPLVIGGLSGSSAQLFSDSSCTTPIGAGDLTFPSGQSTYTVYLKDLVAEALSGINVVDTAAQLTPFGGVQSMVVTAAKIQLTGPQFLIAGECTTGPFFVAKLIDASSPPNEVIPTTPTDLRIGGISGTGATAHLDLINCSAISEVTELTIPGGVSGVSFAITDSTAEVLNITVEDINGVIEASDPIQLTVLPSELEITGPTKITSLQCSPAFQLAVTDGAQPFGVADDITVNLGGIGEGGAFYSDSNCENEITSILFETGESTHPFYVKSLGGGSRTLTAADSGGEVDPESYALEIESVRAFIGGGAHRLAWFERNVLPDSPREDHFRQISAMHIQYMEVEGEQHQFLYVVDDNVFDNNSNDDRILKYDVTDQKYIGYIGRYISDPSYRGIRGSHVNEGLNISCAILSSGSMTPGWCYGGRTYTTNNNDLTASEGTLMNIVGITSGTDENGTYIYVTRYDDNGAILRFDAVTGSFQGWIGVMGNTAGAGATPAVGSLVSCTNTPENTRTPGWCIGGNVGANYTSSPKPLNNEWLHYPGEIEFHNGNLYVATHGAVQRFNAQTGAFTGWIGYLDSHNVGATLPTNPSPGERTCEDAGGNALEATDLPMVTPGWCIGGQTRRISSDTVPGGIEHAITLSIDSARNQLLVGDTSSNYGAYLIYDLTTGAFIKRIGQPAQVPRAYGNDENAWPNQASMGEYMVFKDYRRLSLVHKEFDQLHGWIGEVGGTIPIGSFDNSAEKNVACTNSGLLGGGITPYWCIGGTPRQGLGEQSYGWVRDTGSIEYDPVEDKLYVAQRYEDGGEINWVIRKYNSDGSFVGTFAAVNDVTKWTADYDTMSPFQQGGFGDTTFYYPTDIHADEGFLYVTERVHGRVKKINAATGKVAGVLGANVSKPTGGFPLGTCLSANSRGFSPGWCLGAFMQPRRHYHWSQNGGNIFVDYQTTPGFLYDPYGVTTDDTYVYVADQALHRINRYNKVTGAYGGWIGSAWTIRPTGGDDGCTSLDRNDVNNRTTSSLDSGNGGWCIGGNSVAGADDGQFNSPRDIVYLDPYLYVQDFNNHRIVRVVASSGKFAGWIGRIDSGYPVVNDSCGPGGYSSGGWCMGGRAIATATNSGNDPNGGMRFHVTIPGMAAVSVDETDDGTDNPIDYLYFSNSYHSRIDKYSLKDIPDLANPGNFLQTDGEFVSTIPADPRNLNLWTDPRPLQPSGSLPFSPNSNFYSEAMWIDAPNDHIYYMYRVFNEPRAMIVVRQLSTGNFLGWQGRVDDVNLSNRPTSGEEGCDGSSLDYTPGWCIDGFWPVQEGFRLGHFHDVISITGDENYIYAADEDQNRIIRIPKKKP